MDHRDVLSRLTPQDRVRLHARSDRAGLAHLAPHLIAILVLSIWIASGGALWMAAVLVQGLLLVFLFTLQHECTHNTPFQSAWLNRLVGQVCGIIILQPFKWFRYFHLAHHRFTNDPQRDPELLSGAKPDTWGQFLWHVSGVPVWLGSVRQILSNAFGRQQGSYVPVGARPKIMREARVYLGIYALAAASLGISDLLIWIWLVPMAAAQPFLRLYLLAEHGRCPSVANMLENTRTTFTTALVRRLAWNMPYHIEHHSDPNVPFHRLPDLHQHMAGHLISTSPGYRSFTVDYTASFTPDG